MIIDIPETNISRLQDIIQHEIKTITDQVTVLQEQVEDLKASISSWVAMAESINRTAPIREEVSFNPNGLDPIVRGQVKYWIKENVMRITHEKYTGNFVHLSLYNLKRLKESPDELKQFVEAINSNTKRTILYAFLKNVADLSTLEADPDEKYKRFGINNTRVDEELHGSAR